MVILIFINRNEQCEFQRFLIFFPYRLEVGKLHKVARENLIC